MKQLFQITLISTLLLFTGCVDGLPSLSSNLTPNEQQALTFQTNQVHFMNSLTKNSSKEERNIFMDEFLLKSDIQCQNYLNNPLKKAQTDSSEDSLYMGIFDTVSTLFGVSLVTNTAKAVFLNNDEASQEEKNAYANALSPEIRKGVELGRSRYAKKMLAKKNLDLKAYSINDFKTDMLKYDKQCNDAYGLIEINRALQEMRNGMYAQPSVQTAPLLKIDPKVIKKKVEAATKEVKEKKIEKQQRDANVTKEISTQPKPMDVKRAIPTQPKPVDVPVHHDSVQNLPRSIQL